MESMGFIFGMAGISFAMIAWGQIAALKKEFEDLKKKLEGAGILGDQADSDEI